jgi:hypothetical protein
VQDIASLLKDEIPTEFNRSVNEQPGITTVHAEVTTIYLTDPDEEKVLRAIVDAIVLAPTGGCSNFQVIQLLFSKEVFFL